MIGQSSSILLFSCNLANLPCKVEGMSGSGNAGLTLSYGYLSDGTKTSAVTETAAGSGAEGLKYRGAFVYELKDGAERLSSVGWSEGRTEYVYAPSLVEDGDEVLEGPEELLEIDDLWYITDHLGNTRAVVNMSGGGTVLEQNEYLPFGTRLANPAFEQGSNRYRLGGKEEQRFGGLDLAMSDFGARYYDPFTARWATRDPLAGKYHSLSPYNYCGGNPVNLVDPDGKDVWEIDNFGNVISQTSDSSQDAFYLVQKNTEGGYDRIKDSDGNDIGIVYEYGTVLSSYNEGGSNFKFEFATNEDGASLFKFLADNTSVEYGLIGTTDNYSSVFTNNSNNSINMLKEAIRISFDGFQLKFLLHNHPINTPPSGFDKNKDVGDKTVAKAIAKMFGPNVRNYVYRSDYPDAVLPYDSVNYAKKNHYFAKELFR